MPVVRQMITLLCLAVRFNLLRSRHTQVWLDLYLQALRSPSISSSKRFHVLSALPMARNVSCCLLCYISHH